MSIGLETLSSLFKPSEKMSQTVVLITGANRGIGHGLLSLYLARPDHIVLAAVRDPNHPTAKALASLPKAEGTELVVLKIDALVATDAPEAVKTLADKHRINHVDILVANAGIALKWVKVAEVTVEDIQKHIDVNVYGFTQLYQAFLPVLQKAKNPKWVTIGSCAAFLTVNGILYSSWCSNVLTLYAVSNTPSCENQILSNRLLTAARLVLQGHDPHEERSIRPDQARPALVDQGHPH